MKLRLKSQTDKIDLSQTKSPNQVVNLTTSHATWTMKSLFENKKLDSMTIDDNTMLDDILSELLISGNKADSIIRIIDNCAKDTRYEIVRQAFLASTDDSKFIKLKEIYKKIMTPLFNDYKLNNDRSIISEFLTDTFKVDKDHRRVLFISAAEVCDELEMSGLKESFKFALDVDSGDSAARKIIDHVSKIMRSAIIPPMNTSNNYEIGVMNEAHCYASISRESALCVGFFILGLHNIINYFAKIRKHGLTSKFGDEWLESGFARVEIGHKLFAALSLTDVPESVDSPWKCWSIVVPPGLMRINFDIVHLQVKIPTEIERIWCKGSDPYAILIKINRDNAVGQGVATINDEIPSGSHIMALDYSQLDTSNDILKKILTNLVRSLCLCINDKKSDRKGNWGSNSNTKPKSRIESVQGEKYIIGRPVQIDLREELKNTISNEKRQSSNAGPKVQFLVRGHWRNQKFGAGRLQSRKQWIEPFWKGDEDMRVLLRPYSVDKKDE